MVSVQEAFTAQQEGRAIIVDVREEQELQEEGKVKSALWLATSSIAEGDESYEEFLQKLPKSQEVIFYCRSGGRSGKVAEYFEEMGFKARNMGAFKSWVEAQLPIESHA